jgi:exodeoxyribonuclease VII small subunit
MLFSSFYALYMGLQYKRNLCSSSLYDKTWQPSFILQGRMIMAKKTFETSLARLEQITEELEDGELSLENSLKKFDEGIKLAVFCTEQLSLARAKVELLLEKDGKIEPIPFNEQDIGHQDLSE